MARRDACPVGHRAHTTPTSFRYNHTNRKVLPPMGRFERQQNKLAKLNQKAEDGKISYDDLVRKEGKVLRKMDKSCRHNNVENEDDGRGGSVRVCQDCTQQV